MVPPTWNVTEATPESSLALADSVSVDPGAVAAGRTSETCGGVVSGWATMTSVSDAVPALRLASRAVAVTWMVSPGAATAGTCTATS